MEKLIVEARINEYQMRRRNPHVPWSAAEIAADAAACREAGAAMVHFHCRHADGTPDHGAAAWAEAIRRVRAASDILVMPTLGAFATDASDAAGRLAPVMTLAGDPATRPDFVPIDTGSGNVDGYDPAARRFRTTDLVYRNDTGTLEYFARNVTAQGMKPYLVAWNISFLRQALALLDMGLADEPAYLMLLLSGDGLLAGHPGTEAGLDAYLGVLPKERRLVWTVGNVGGDLLPLTEKIVRAGGHISIGLGDYPFAEYGTPTNAELIRRVAKQAEALGRPCATPAEARQILQMP